MKDLKSYINTLRKDFAKEILSENEVNANPIVQFEKWFKEAIDAQVNEPNAMTVCTATKEGRPSARVLLLRNFSKGGFVYYTNYNSRKGCEIAKNPYCALLFFWPELERQVRIEGIARKQSTKESDLYFNTRPHGSKIGAWASEQSKVIANRDKLTKAYEKISEKFAGKEITRPPHWGGYLLKPSSIEFWQGRPSRLHDRILYSKEGNNWKIERLSP